MQKRQIYLVMLILVLLGVFSSAVYAQGMLDTVLRPLERINIGKAYEDHWYIIDCIMYFIILVGVSQYVFQEQFKGSGGKAIIIGMGVSLSVAAAFFEYKNGFRLLEVFGPIAIIVVVLLFMVGIYKFAKALGAGGRGFAMLAFAFLFFYITAMMPSLTGWFANNSSEFIRLIWALLNILAIVFLIWGLIDVISSLAKLGGGGAGAAGGGGDTGGDRGDTGRGRDQGRADEPGGEGPPKEEDFDYGNPADVTTLVTDVDDEPIKGATVTITGPRSGWPRHWPTWRRRGPYWTGKTGNDGRTPTISVPAGNLRFDVRHPGYSFFDLVREGRRYTTTYQIVKPNDTVEIHVRLRRFEREPEPEILNIQPTDAGVYFHGRIN